MNEHDIETAADAIGMIANSTSSTWSEVLDALTGPVLSEQEAQEIRDYLK